MSLSPHILARLIALSLFLAVMGGTWDAWWHSALGRESFWSPPHLLMYAADLAAIGLGVYGWSKTREKKWKYLAIVLCLVPLSAPFDELWHRYFGVEALNSPLITWSPPHVVLILGIFLGFALTLPILKQDHNRPLADMISASAFAGMLSLLIFLLSPVDPTGPWHLLSFWGAGLFAFVLAGTLLYAKEHIALLPAATLVTMTFFILRAMSFGEKIGPGVVIPPHEHPPAWLVIFSMIFPAVLLDVLHKTPTWLRGGLYGLFSTGILYGFSSQFFASEFQYSLALTAQAIVASIVGGIMAGLVSKQLAKRLRA